MRRRSAPTLGLTLDFRQSNHEGVLIDWVHEAFEAGWAVVGNFGGYTHTSIALMDALAVVSAPVVEVHISDIHAREEFRRTSYVSLVADDHVIGQGVAGYAEALRRVAASGPEPDRSGCVTSLGAGARPSRRRTHRSLRWSDHG